VDVEVRMSKFKIGDKVTIRAADTPYDGYHGEVVEYDPKSVWPYRVQVIIKEDYVYAAKELEEEQPCP